MKTPFARKRNRDSRKAVVTNSRHQQFAPLPPLDTSGPAWSNVEGETQEMTDVVTPGHATVITNGGIINSPMSRAVSSTLYGLGAVVQTRTHPLAYAGAEIYTYTGTYMGVFDLPLGAGFGCSLDQHLPNNLSSSKLAFEAAVRARNGVNPVLVQSIVSIAEFPKTVNLLRNGIKDLAKTVYQVIRETNLKGKQKSHAKQIYETIFGVRRGQPVSTFSAAGGISSRWLEWRYGWRILLMEIQGVIKALDNKRVSKTRYTSRGNAADTRIGQVNRNISLGPNGTATLTFTQTEDASARAYVLYEADLAYQSARDFGVTELPLALWELIPLSFVVDWLVSVGNWLEALTPKIGIKVLAEGVKLTHRRRVSRQATAYAPPTSGTDRYVMTGLMGPIDTREVLAVERRPSLSGSLLYPRLNVKIDVKRALDAIALVVTGYQRASYKSIRI